MFPYIKFLSRLLALPGTATMGICMNLYVLRYLARRQRKLQVLRYLARQCEIAGASLPGTAAMEISMCFDTWHGGLANMYVLIRDHIPVPQGSRMLMERGHDGPNTMPLVWTIWVNIGDLSVQHAGRHWAPIGLVWPTI